MKKGLYLFTLATMFLVCGEGEAKNSILVDEEKLKKIQAEWAEVPDMPSVNHADYNTLKGIDEDNDNIRDDWEVANALASYPNKDEFKLLNMAAKNNNLMIDAYAAKDDDEMLKVFYNYTLITRCYKVIYNFSNSNMLSNKGLDSKDRQDNFKEWGAYLNNILPDVIERSSYSKLKNECNTLIK